MMGQRQLEKLDEVILEVKAASFEEKKKAMNVQEKVNKFLDGVYLIKTAFHETNAKIDQLLPVIEELTWLTEIDETGLIKIHEILVFEKDLFTTLNKNIPLFKKYNIKGVLDMERYQINVSSILESIQTLEAVFLYFPSSEGFQENTTLQKNL